jgi:hypothetical protein
MEKDERSLFHARKINHFFVESGERASEYLTQVVHYLHNFCVRICVYVCFQLANMPAMTSGAAALLLQPPSPHAFVLGPHPAATHTAASPQISLVLYS